MEGTPKSNKNAGTQRKTTTSIINNETIKKMKKRILLKENENLAQSIIELEQNQATNWGKVDNLLNECGLNVQNITSWTDIDSLLLKDFQFPKATIEFNLDALGIRTQYEQAKKIYYDNLRGTQYAIEVTAERIEEIKEEQRVYVTNQNQIDVIAYAEKLVESVNKLNSLGIRIDVNGILDCSTLFKSEARGSVAVNERNLFLDVQKII
ncbi:hypothetical protein EKM02_13440 [Flavobacterium sp. RSP49]|uniref:hypothetical protein n=1 Tax=Flavobacterium sp. RSP49 TaxID=2497487 RepID=UPI000F843A5E|nr:hypothetical protein [Flavobacterium sp. RSP49]RTY97603.1 hypothetical protein EKM02_13440 [Flavobacterium sp. RSP49]